MIRILLLLMFSTLYTAIAQAQAQTTSYFLLKNNKENHNVATATFTLKPLPLAHV